ncbi:hypothetical protein LMG26689_05169 [Achromobacter animicus]|uniref:hypothetical protein n=1 Tax=Achromobacter animicus TaxID=1389935 RepID=UPI00146524F5|nr:hypothetical protein [Achromobacter animicus]CAB3914219.1 hypothetical protein LMG26689_05169 [Achromobacter animicus]
MNLKTDGDARSIAAVARLSLDGNRERIEGMKETYDRLFAMIATLGALLAFLGFKGFESFMQARDDAQETVERSKGAVLEAEGAKTQADAALKELHQFLRVDYPKDNSAEINVAHGLVMREIAVLYSCMAEKMGKDIKDFPEYREVLHLSLVYLNKVRLQADRLDKRVIARALITIGNVESLLGNSRGALEACQEVIEKHSPDDESAHFNAACYACRLGAEEAAKESHKTAKAYADLSIARLTRAIELLPSNRLDASTDKDFVWLREQGNPAFMSLLAEP